MRQPREGLAGRRWVEALAFGVAYALLAGACDLLFRFGTDAIAMFWVPSALTLAVLLRAATERWPLLLSALFVAALLEALWLREPLPVTIGWAAGVTLEPVIGATLLRRFLLARPGLSRVSDVFVFVVIGALLAPMLSGVVGATVTAGLLGRPWLHAWQHWWMSAGLGVVLFAPLFLSLGARSSVRSWTGPRRLELALLVVVTGVLAWFWSREPVGSSLALPLPVVITVPLLLWGALRFGVKGSGAVSVTAAVSAGWNAVHGHGPFLGVPVEAQFVATQSFLAVMSVGGLVLAVTLDERLRAEAGQRLLADVGALLASEHDELRALQRVADRVVPELADGCAIALYGEGQPARVVVARHVRPKLEPALQAVVTRCPPAPLRVRHFDSECLERLVSEGAPAEALAALEPESMLNVPLHANRMVVGTVFLVGGGPLRLLDERGEVLADEVARRCELALESARLRREQAQAIRSRDDFLSIASHELKTPLTPLLLQLARMARRVDSGAEVNPDWIAKARVSAMRLSALIDDLLDAGKIASGRLALRKEPMQLEPMLREVTGTFSSASARHTIALRLPDHPVWVCADRFRLEQVLANLLDNAIKYSPLGGTITLSLEVHGERAALSVSDQGIGIPPDQQRHLFERFFRARNSPSQFFGGLGLGLFICRDIVERHGGEIWVESRPGEGSTFHVDLPLHAFVSPDRPVQPAVEEGPPPAELR